MTDLDGWGTPFDVAITLARSEHTIRTWARRRLVKTRTDPDTGALLVWWPDCLTRTLRSYRRGVWKDHNPQDAPYQRSA